MHWTQRDLQEEKINRLASEGFSKSQALMHSWVDSMLRSFKFLLKWNLGKYYCSNSARPGSRLCKSVNISFSSLAICAVVLSYCEQCIFMWATFATLFSHPSAPFVLIWTGAQDHQTSFMAQKYLYAHKLWKSSFWHFCRCRWGKYWKQSKFSNPICRWLPP